MKQFYLALAALAAAPVWAATPPLLLRHGERTGCRNRPRMDNNQRKFRVEHLGL